MEWLFWQVGGLGPMAGQVSHFVNYAPNFPGDHSYSEKRYKDEYDRLLGVMNRVLDERDYLAGDYSIADMASFPWVTAYKRYEVDLDLFSNVRRWFDDIKSRPAVRKGIEVGKEVRNFGKGISKESLKTMFGQDAKSISEMAKAKEKIAFKAYLLLIGSDHFQNTYLHRLKKKVGEPNPPRSIKFCVLSISLCLFFGSFINSRNSSELVSRLSTIDLRHSSSAIFSPSVQ